MVVLTVVFCDTGKGKEDNQEKFYVQAFAHLARSKISCV